MENKIIIYSSGKVNVKIKLDDETIWMTQKQIAELFNVNIPAVNKHLGNIFGSKELDEKSVVSKMEITAADGKMYNTSVYNLDAVISVGYRVNSKKATQFRIWATNTLKRHLVDGYTVNEKRLIEQKERFQEIRETILMIGEKAKFEELSGHEKDLLDVIAEYAKTWELLNKFDKDKLGIGKVHKYTKFDLSYENYQSIIGQVRKNASKIEKGNTLLGVENGEKMKGIVGAISQTFGGEELYPSIEEKAAHILYFTIKDHPFVDGNKRIASLLFVYYLEKNNHLYRGEEKKLNDNAIVALALLVATSNPREKDNIVKLIINLIN
jgi:prophage maintenance system killer protein